MRRVCAPECAACLTLPHDDGATLVCSLIVVVTAIYALVSLRKATSRPLPLLITALAMGVPPVIIMYPVAGVATSAAVITIVLFRLTSLIQNERAITGGPPAMPTLAPEASQPSEPPPVFAPELKQTPLAAERTHRPLAAVVTPKPPYVPAFGLPFAVAARSRGACRAEFRAPSAAPTYRPAPATQPHAEHVSVPLPSSPGVGLVRDRRNSPAVGAGIKLPVLSAHDRAKLEAGQLVIQRGVFNELQQGMAVQRVAAPPQVLWSRILDFAKWPKMIDNVTSTNIYEDSRRADGRREMKVEVVIGVSLVRIRTNVHHVYDDVNSCMTWKLDTARESDLLSNEGFWLVREDEGDARASVVYYSVALTLKSWAPTWMEKFIAKQGLPKAVGWVKRESESRQMRRVQSLPDLVELDAQ